MLDEISHEQFEEWSAYFALRPDGWDATRIAVARISWLIAATHSRRKQNERDFELKMSVGSSGNEKLQRDRMEAYSIRMSLAAGEKFDG